MKIAQVIQADSWGDVTPEALERGIGGREGAMIRLATEWAKLGHEVTNFVPTKEARRYQETVYNVESDCVSRRGFHEYVPLNLTKPMLAAFPYDAVVAWECPSIFQDERIRQKQKVRLTHMQVAHLNEIEMPAANEYATGLVALSEWAKQFLVQSGLTQKNLYVRPNGVDISNYPLHEVSRAVSKSLSGPPSFVYSSSPDRGLEHLLSMWPKIRELYPGANLYVGYGVDKYTEDVKWAHNKVGEMSLNIIEGMKQPGVVDIGKIGQKRLAQIQINATAWLYPADTIQATETGCITAIENMAAGNPCIMSDADCLGPEFGEVSIVNPLPFKEERYVDELHHLLQTPHIYSQMVERGRKFAESRDWSRIAPTWIDLFKEQNEKV